MTETTNKLNIVDDKSTTKNSSARRFSLQTIIILKCLLEKEGVHGYEVVKATGLKGGTVYPTLKRLEKQEWVDSFWDIENKPPRQVFSINESNKESLERQLENAILDLEILREDSEYQ